MSLRSDYGRVAFDIVTFGNSVSVITVLSQLKQPNLILVHLDFKIQSKHPPTQLEISAENVKMKVLLSFTNLFKSHIYSYIYKHLIIFQKRGDFLSGFGLLFGFLVT